MERAVLTALIFLAAAAPAPAQPTPLRFRQAGDGAAVEVLSAADAATLGDPLFGLVLKDRANLTKLADVEIAIQPNAEKRRLFVVSERVVRAAKQGSRRSVLAFDGTNGGEPLKGNVMLAASFGPAGFTDAAEIEAWGWDNHRGRYNYYKLDAAGAPPGQMVWKFRGSSEKADLLTPAERKGTCLACHVTGGPVMKELAFPWNNWHGKVGPSFRATYLDPADPAADKWPAAGTLRFKRLAGADELETSFLVPSFKRFNQSRLNAALKRDDDTGNRAVARGRMTVLEGRRLLRPLFETVEVNLMSSGKTSGFHPFGPAADFVPAAEIPVPDNFFLNTELILGGLKLKSSAEFRSFAKLTQQENRDLIEATQLRLNGVAGDTHFGWLVPAPGFLDNDMAARLLRLGAVSPHFLAAVLAIDLEAPTFSARRAELLRLVPDRFEFAPLDPVTDPTEVARDPAADLLTKTVVDAIDRAEPAPGSAADEFRTLLKSDDAVRELDRRVNEYAKRVKTELTAADPARRKAELKRLYHVLIDRRRAFRAHPVLGNLDETQGLLLFPLPAGG